MGTGAVVLYYARGSDELEVSLRTRIPCLEDELLAGCWSSIPVKMSSPTLSKFGATRIIAFR